MAPLPPVPRSRHVGRSATRRARWLALVAAVAACAPGVPALARSGRAGALRASAAAGFGTQGGYVWEGDTRSVGASWVVPPIPRGSRRGEAGTWIGAQHGLGASTRFIQVGVIETTGFAPGRASSYYAFWSDTARHFHAVDLFPVPPRSRVTAGLSLSHGHWTVAIRDTATGRDARFTTTEDSLGVFHFAEWLQEDPATEGGAGPYPALYRVAFDKVSLNGAVPRYLRLHSQWMTVNSLDLGPGPFVGDSFELTRRTLSAPARRFLGIADDVDGPFAAFGSALNWKGMPSLSELDSARASIATALTRNIEALRREQWPAVAVGFVNALATRTSLLLAGVEQLPGTTMGAVDAWRRNVAALERPINPVAQELRRALGAPQLQPAVG